MFEWVGDTVKANPQLKEYRDAKKPAKTRPAKITEFSTERSAVPPGRQGRFGVNTARGSSVSQTTLAPGPPAQRDDSDPAWFNEWAHPHGNPWRTVSTAQK